MKRIAILMSMLAIALAGTFAVSLGSSTASAQPGELQAVPPAVQTFIDAVNAADSNAMAASFTDHGYFEDLSPSNGPFGIFGMAALQSGFSDIGQQGIHVTLTASEVNGNMVSGTVELANNTTRAAGVDRYVETFVATLDGDKLASFVLHYDTNDSQTATYSQYQADHPEEDSGPEPTDFVELHLGGNEPGDAGIGSIAAGVSVVFTSIEGPDGVEQPSAIYSGTCAGLGGVVQPLAPSLKAGSGNFVSMSLDDLLGSPHAITIAAADDPNVIVSCANIERSAAAVGLPNTGTGASTGMGLSWLIAGLALAGVALAGAGTVAARRRS